MADLNHVVLIGRLTHNLSDDERNFGYIGNGQARANVSIAVNRNKKNGDQWVDEVNYFNVTIWGKTAENLKPYLTKGKQVCIEGHLKQDRWEKDGQKQSRVSIIADSVQLLGGATKDGANGQSSVPEGVPKFQALNNNQGGQNNYQNNNSGNENYQGPSYGDTGSDFPEDIPF